MSVTIKDIAKIANVSIATVSRVLTNSKPVSPELRDKIMKVMQETGYQPNAIARSLVSKKTGIVGVMIPDLANDNFSALINGIESVMNTLDYSLFLAITDGKAEKEIRYLQLFNEKQLDGIILSGVQYLEDHRHFLQKNEIPLVAVGQEFSEYNIPSVNIDNVSAAYDATIHLIESGHQQIAFISAPLRDEAAGKDRWIGFKNALSQHNLSFSDDYFVEGDFTPASGYKAMERLLVATPRPTAVFVAADRMAVGALNCIYDHGLQVPEDFSLIGFDDTELASLVRPPLTTIHIDPFEFGREAANLLISLLNKGVSENKVILPHRLVIRKTVKTII